LIILEHINREHGSAIQEVGVFPRVISKSAGHTREPIPVFPVKQRRLSMERLLFLFCGFPVSMGYFADWSMLARDKQPTCVDIPSNMTLCHNIGYTKMRLPNLVEHDTLHEVSQQSMSWIPLLNIKCHPDTQLFLCSLFSPVCLERPIYPCRSLCQKVRAGCEGRMQAYGFPWPAMLDCEKFPQDNDMCITAQSAKTPSDDNGCTGRPCDQHLSAENILDNFCRADFVVKVRIGKVKPRKLIGKKAQVFRAWKGTREEMRALRNPKFVLSSDEKCCAERARANKKGKFLVMGTKPSSSGGDLKPTFIVPWSKTKEIKRARRMFKSMNCENLRETSQKIIVDTFAPRSSVTGDNRKRRGSRRPKGERKRSGQRKRGGERKKKSHSIWDGIRN